MKRLATLGALLAAGAALIAPVQAAEGGHNMCLKTYYIDRTTVVDPRTILFQMKDGKVYRSTLRTPCGGLKFNGFEYVAAFDEVCGGAQSIRVLRTNQVCLLGPFVPEPAQHG